MKFKQLLLYTLIFISILACNNEIEKTNQSKAPNLFLFLADDLSYFDLNSTGNKFVNSPNIDAFAKNAIEFTKMYTPSAMCAPSRSALLTGLYPHRNACHYNHGAVAENVKSLPQYLRTLGYRVALVGKRHIKPESVFNFDYIKKDSLENYLKQGGPVCVFFASNRPHKPHVYDQHPSEKTQLPKKWVDTKNTRRELAGYYDNINKLDKQFADFLKIIENAGQSENALTIFTSDHGYEMFAKWTCYEAGVRVPFFVQAKGLDLPIRKVKQLTSFVDVVPTFIELAGGSPPKEIDGNSFVTLLEGDTEAIHPFIYGTHSTRGIYSGKAYPIRSISDGKWKYIINLNYEEKFQNIVTNGWNFGEPPLDGLWRDWLAILDGKGEGADWVAYYQNRPKEELYNLENDPFEMNNLVEDGAFLEIKNKLDNELENWMKQQKDEGMVSEMKVPLKIPEKK